MPIPTYQRGTGVAAGMLSVAFSLAGLVCCMLFAAIAFLPSLLGAGLACRAVSSAQTTPSRFVAFVALVTAIPAVGLSCMVLFVPFGW